MRTLARGDHVDGILLSNPFAFCEIVFELSLPLGIPELIKMLPGFGKHSNI